VVGRDSGLLRLRVVEHADGATLREFVRRMTWPLTMVYTDEWAAYDRLPEVGRGHATVCHAAGEWARDDDGDGIREVHDNTLEGIWTGLRNYLRRFRGVNKAYLAQYVAVFLWSYNIKAVTDEFLRALMGVGSVPGERLCRGDVDTSSCGHSWVARASPFAAHEPFAAHGQRSVLVYRKCLP
jgi:transposase